LRTGRLSCAKFNAGFLLAAAFISELAIRAVVLFEIASICYPLHVLLFGKQAKGTWYDNRHNGRY